MISSFGVAVRVILTGAVTLAAVSSISFNGTSGVKKCSRCELRPAETCTVGLVGLRVVDCRLCYDRAGAENLAEDSERVQDAKAPERYSLKAPSLSRPFSRSLMGAEQYLREKAVTCQAVGSRQPVDSLVAASSSRGLY